MTSLVNVNLEAIRSQACSVDGVSGGVAKALEAANYLAHADDGYGLLVKPYAVITLNALHDDITEALTLLDTLASEMPGKLRTAADTFETCDTTRAGDLSGKTAEIERSV
ncbi:type VII secretion target [Nocardia alba]|uniref:Excreted virulence factor EspC (Type VII ESX diderm) n=1 Tax=Nocardia alba TaxID=225051 RepID=A0A4R1FPA3_9NOCA|nr:type VII secretion target [Nocardia alba]TCJ95294.1 excreted virulence factor EspC (type VII ESX diderm) [Nocardia alba]